MKVEVQNVYGIGEALFGIGLSYGITSGMEEIDPLNLKETGVFEELRKIANKLAYLSGGENKFLRQIQVWLDLTFPRYVWCEFDTYKVGTTAQSESTMHTILKSPITQKSFEEGEGLPDVYIESLELLRKKCNETKDRKYWRALKQMLPESFLQRRIVNLNYAVIQNMLQHRYNHGLQEWRYFCKEMAKLPYAEQWLLPRRKDGTIVDLQRETDTES